MPRTYTAPEFALWESGEFVVHLDVLIERVIGGAPTLQSYRDFSGRNWIRSLKLDPPGVDRSIGSGMLTLHRQVGAASLATMMQSSALNLDGATYAPALDFGREVEVRVALMAPGASPAAGDWKTIFQGTTDDPVWGGKGSSVVQVPFRDGAGYLSDTYIRDERAYGSDDGVDAVEVMQAILDDQFGASYYALQDLTTGDRFMVTSYRVLDVSVWQALETLALQWGGKRMAFVWNESEGQFQPSVIEPPRSKTTPDFEVSPSTYIDVDNIATGGKNLRTIVRGTTVSAAGAVLTKQIPAEEDVATDPKVLLYGQRYMGVNEGATSEVDTQDELDAMVQAIYDDVSTPVIPLEPQTKLCWFAAVDDLVTWGANTLLFDVAQDSAILNLSHDFPSPGVGRTRFRCAGSPKGAYAGWPAVGIPIAGRNARDLGDTYFAIYNVREVLAQSTATHYAITWDQGAGVEEIWGAFGQYERETNEGWAELAAAIVYIADDNSTVLLIPRPVEGEVTLLQLEPRYVDTASRVLTAGGVSRSAWGAGAIREGVVDVDVVEVAGIATAYWKEQGAGISVTDRDVYVQAGHGAPEGPVAPTRGPGDTSVVYSRELQAGEYEHDATIATEGRTVILPYLTYASGRVYLVKIPPFDPGLDPLLLQPIGGVEFDVADGIAVSGDGDVRSLKAYRTDVADTDPDYWEEARDATAFVFMPPVPSTERWAVRVRGYSVPKLQQATATPEQYDERDVFVDNGAAAPGMTWEAVNAEEPPTDGNDEITIALNATAPVGGFTARVWYSLNTGYGWSPYLNVTSELSPALSAPPGSATDYAWASGQERQTPDPGLEHFFRLAQFSFRCEILDGSGIVVDTEYAEVSYYVLR